MFFFAMMMLLKQITLVWLEMMTMMMMKRMHQHYHKDYNYIFVDPMLVQRKLP